MHDDYQLGPTRQFPDGKWHSEDEGELRIAIGHQRGCVCLQFGAPLSWAAMPPDRARALAWSLLEHASAIDGNPIGFEL